MRAVTIAAAGAAVIGSVSASSHVKQLHARLHNNVARDTWVDWNSTSTVGSTTKVDGASTTKWGGSSKTTESTTSSTTTTTKKVPSQGTTSSSSSTTTTTTTTTTSKVPSAETTSSTASGEHSWEDWSSTTTSTEPVDGATTSSSITSDDYTWADWESSTTSSKPVDPETTSSSDEYTWADWESTTTSTSTKPVDPATISSFDWADWESSSSAVEPATSEDPSHTWVDWVEPTTTITVKSTVTSTKYVEPVTHTAVDPSHTWADWESSSASVSANVSKSASSSSVAPVTRVLTSTIIPGWSASGWFGPSWSLEAGSCAVSIITSYGRPTWHPVADPTTTTTSSTTTSTTPTVDFTWQDWSSTTSTKPVGTSTTSSSSSSSSTTTSSASTWGGWTLTVPTFVSTSADGGSWGAPGSSATGSASWGAPSSSVTESGSWGMPSISTSESSSASASGSGSSPKPSGGSGSGGYPGITPNGNSWALTYSPYTAGGGCKDAGTVAKDLAIIAGKGFSSIRVYSTDCSTLENVGKSARDNGLKLILGVWVSSTGIDAAKGQVADIVAWKEWDLVELIVVGNEVVFNQIASASELAGFISSSASAFKSAGYEGPVTTTEPLSVWEDSNNAAALVGGIDVLGANLYAFFNAQISADKAGQFIQDEIDILKGISNGKPIYVLESGWPHSGNANGAAVPSPENQAIALKGIQAAVGAQVCFLAYEDELWKEPGPLGVEQSWGCASVF